jgi:hypothetical protein
VADEPAQSLAGHGRHGFPGNRLKAGERAGRQLVAAAEKDGGRRRCDIPGVRRAHRRRADQPTQAPVVADRGRVCRGDGLHERVRALDRPGKLRHDPFDVGRQPVRRGRVMHRRAQRHAGRGERT